MKQRQPFQPIPKEKTDAGLGPYNPPPTVPPAAPPPKKRRAKAGAVAFMVFMAVALFIIASVVVIGIVAGEGTVPLQFAAIGILVLLFYAWLHHVWAKQRREGRGIPGDPDLPPL